MRPGNSPGSGSEPPKATFITGRGRYQTAGCRDGAATTPAPRRRDGGRRVRAGDPARCETASDEHWHGPRQHHTVDRVGSAPMSVIAGNPKHQRQRAHSATARNSALRPSVAIIFDAIGVTITPTTGLSSSQIQSHRKCRGGSCPERRQISMLRRTAYLFSREPPLDPIASPPGSRLPDRNGRRIVGRFHHGNFASIPRVRARRERLEIKRPYPLAPPRRTPRRRNPAKRCRQVIRRHRVRRRIA
jgi:hypothetical protein